MEVFLALSLPFSLFSVYTYKLEIYFLSFFFHFHHSVGCLKRSTFSNWDTPLLLSLIHILPKDYLEENGEEALNQSPIGTGPFEFVDWVVSSHLNMKRFEGYWGEKPSFENLQIRFIADDTARNIALETGELDVAAMIQEADINSILEGNVEHVVGYMVPGQQVNYFAFNAGNVPAFADIRVRQAMAHAVDWPAALKAANGEIFSLCESCIAPTIEYYTPAGTYEMCIRDRDRM